MYLFEDKVCDMETLAKALQANWEVDDHRQRIGGSWTADETAGVDFVCPELVAIAPEFITAYITEAGILPPTAMYTAGLNYAAKLGGANA